MCFSLLLRFLAFACVLLGTSSLAFAQSPAPSPCADSLYQSLRSKALNELSEREYQYFMQREKSCTDYQMLTRLANQPKPSAPVADRRPSTEAYTQGSALGGGADVFVRNTGDRPIIVNSIRVYDCENIRATSCGMHYPKTKLAPGESRRVLTIRYNSPDQRANYRYQYHTSVAAVEPKPGP
jgi:hypothetical protein